MLASLHCFATILTGCRINVDEELFRIQILVSETRSKNKVSGSFRLKFSISMLFLKAIPIIGVRL